jgi:hypothetical protein
VYTCIRVNFSGGKIWDAYRPGLLKHWDYRLHIDMSQHFSALCCVVLCGVVGYHIKKFLCSPFLGTCGYWCTWAMLPLLGQYLAWKH